MISHIFSYAVAVHGFLTVLDIVHFGRKIIVDVVLGLSMAMILAETWNHSGFYLQNSAFGISLIKLSLISISSNL
uniref:Uncharacterized protein n=1 Tax=Romanomermis culicivorax TaxID=13658 RepID=A0A915I5P3_ROMCU